MKLKIACLQMDIAFGKPEDNFKAAEIMIKRRLGIIRMLLCCRNFGRLVMT